MLAETFRSDPGRVGRLKAILQDPTLALALVVLKDDSQVLDVPESADPIASARRLSYLAGGIAKVDLLLSLAEPLPVELPEEEPTFGVRVEDFKFPKPL